MLYQRGASWAKLPERIAIVFVTSLVFLCLAACEHKPSDQEIERQAAKTAQQIKKGAKEMATDARVAAANAERKADDIAAGVRQGLGTDGKPSAVHVDINSATEDQLVELPGISGSRASRIVHGRPYSTPHDLVTRGILTREQYGRISAQVVAN